MLCTFGLLGFSASALRVTRGKTLGMDLGIQAFQFAMLVSIFVIFLLGILFSRLSKEFWLWAGLRTLAVAGLTVLIIYSFNI